MFRRACSQSDKNISDESYNSDILMADHVDAHLWNTIPRFAHGTCLGEGNAVSAALAMETAAPLPPPPEPSPLNAKARITIKNYPHLFKIVTPIDIDTFKN